MQPQQPPQQPASSLFDKHTIETPEQMPLEFAIAGVGSRFLALLIDTLIQIGVVVCILIVVIILGVTGTITPFIQRQSVWVAAAFIGALFLLNFGYFAFFEILWNGQTPGKRKVGIRVIKDSGRPLTPAETIGRNFLRILDQLPGFYAIGILVALLNRQNKRIGDFLAGSLVIRETPFEAIKPVWQTGGSQAFSQEQPSSPDVSEAARISIEDLTLIETFLQRRHELAPDVRSRMADQILTRLRDKQSLATGGEASPESILESLARERRSAGGFS
jgi:uncharacterized RDD family membrane protein YckC